MEAMYAAVILDTSLQFLHTRKSVLVRAVKSLLSQSCSYTSSVDALLKYFCSCSKFTMQWRSMHGA